MQLQNCIVAVIHSEHDSCNRMRRVRWRTTVSVYDCCMNARRRASSISRMPKINKYYRWQWWRCVQIYLILRDSVIEASSSPNKHTEMQSHTTTGLHIPEFLHSKNHFHTPCFHTPHWLMNCLLFISTLRRYLLHSQNSARSAGITAQTVLNDSFKTPSEWRQWRAVSQQWGRAVPVSAIINVCLQTMRRNPPGYSWRIKKVFSLVFSD